MADVRGTRPLVSLGRETCGDLVAALRREWLVTNGIGGYAMGTLAGIASRRYHGLLVAALAPPVGRTVLVGALAEWAAVDGQRVALHAHEYADGTIDQHGYRALESFELHGARPVWTFALGDVRLEKRIWMAHGSNTTYVRYAVSPAGAARPVILELTPLVTQRDHHLLTTSAGGAPAVEPLPAAGRPGAWAIGAVVRPPGGTAPYRLLADRGSFEPGGEWFVGFRHRAETARGLDDRSDLSAAGTFRAVVHPGEPLTLAFTTETGPLTAASVALAASRVREMDLLRRARAEHSSAFLRQLVLAADAFLVDRAIPAGPRGEPAESGRSVIAGYPWFNDWGRDTMISLPGLALATGRAEEARTILRAFGRFVADGLLPNNFPDIGGEPPAHNTVDASLWYPVAIRAYAEATGDTSLVDELLPVVRDILDHHLAGTRFGIAMDPADGLLRAGEPGVQLTWMDAKVDEWVVTPRIGKPVEIQALWVNALRIVGEWLAARENPDSRSAARRYLDVADRATAAFRARFWRPERGYLADVVDGPDGDDLSLRPNQLFAISLPHPLIDGDMARAVVDAIGRLLLTSLGLRTLAPADPAYRGRYNGDRRFRDGAYHQGTAWSWLLGPYVDAFVRVTGDRERALAALRPLEHHLSDAGLGSISEVFDGDPPHDPWGCIAQAWGVAEVLRTWRALAGE